MKDTIPTITTGALPAARKVYASGALHGIRVPMREIAISNEAPLTVYDSSGPYTDPAATIDIAEGLGEARGGWLQSRGEIEEYEGRTVTASASRPPFRSNAARCAPSATAR